MTFRNLPFLIWKQQHCKVNHSKITSFAVKQQVNINTFVISYCLKEEGMQFEGLLSVYAE